MAMFNSYVNLPEGRLVNYSEVPMTDPCMVYSTIHGSVMGYDMVPYVFIDLPIRIVTPPRCSNF